MTESTQAILLRRMTRPHGQTIAENPLTSSRAVRLALTKVCNDTVGLVLTVESVAEETFVLDDMLETLGDDLMLVSLTRGDAVTGIIALDTEMRAAVLEMETMGAVLGQPAEARNPTHTDKALCERLLQNFVEAFPQAVVGTPLEGWMDDVTVDQKFDSVRAAGLILSDCLYRIVRMNVDLGVAERRAALLIALPLVEETAVAEAAPPPPVDWAGLFHENVSDAPACLEGLLFRGPISLATAQSLQVGTVLPLPGCTVNSVRLLAADGQEVAQAKLGQIGGYRAVRLEPAPAPQLVELARTPEAPIANGTDDLMIETVNEMPFNAEVDAVDPGIPTEDDALSLMDGALPDLPMEQSLD